MGYVKDITIGSSTYPVEPMLYAVAGGTASAITASIPNFDLHTGACVQIKMTVDNIAVPTLKVENSGYNVIKYKGAGLTAGFLKAGLVYAFVYDGVDWVLIGQILEVVDSLSNTSTDKALSAAQGKALQESKVNTTDIVNNLTSTETDKPLSAAQGKILNDAISAIWDSPSIAENTDLNSITSIGFHRCASAATGASLRNSPINTAFIMVVIPSSSSSRRVQILFHYNTNNTYVRRIGVSDASLNTSWQLISMSNIS